MLLGYYNYLISLNSASAFASAVAYQYCPEYQKQRNCKILIVEKISFKVQPLAALFLFVFLTQFFWCVLKKILFTGYKFLGTLRPLKSGKSGPFRVKRFNSYTYGVFSIYWNYCYLIKHKSIYHRNCNFCWYKTT